MPMQMKRPAAKASGEPKAKKQEDPFVAKCNTIISLLSTAEGYPDVALQMLQVGAKVCLAVPKEFRTEVQNSLIEMINEVLNSVRVGHVARADAWRSKLAEADAEKKKREAAAEAAAAMKMERVDAVEVAEKNLEEASATTIAAKEALKAAVSEQMAGDADLLKAEAKKALAEKAAAEDLSPLKDGTATDIATAVKTVAKVGKDLGLEVQLLQLGEVAIRKTPTERGNFDDMVVQQFAEQFDQAILKLADQLASGELGKAERAGRVESSSQHVDASVAHLFACQEQLGLAKSSLKEAETAMVAAKKSAEDCGWEMEEVAANVEAADVILMRCKADVATFVELVEGSPVVPEIAPPEAEVMAAPLAVDAEVLPVATLDATGAEEAPAKVANAKVVPGAIMDAAPATVPNATAPNVSIDAPGASIHKGNFMDSEGSASLSFAFGGL